MPKMKTNRLAYKKLRVNAKGKVSHARAFTSHNTGKRSAKRNRQLKGCRLVGSTEIRAVRGLLPYHGARA
ncbi:MAG: 50S ribosomal protein L35 [Proteobacteria bacterium]|nr:MAG: 50S ribosomal protein L35 [Pseudomonadota bacterium]